MRGLAPDHLAVIDNSEIAAVLESAFGTKRTSRRLGEMPHRHALRDDEPRLKSTRALRVPSQVGDGLVKPGKEHIDHVCKNLRVFPPCPRWYIKGVISVRNQL